MKILYISGDMGVEVGGRKGASTHVRETCNALVRFGHQVRILTPCPGDLTHVHAEVVPVHASRAKWLGSDTRYLILNRRMASAIKHQIETFKPDAIYERYSLYQTSGATLARRYNLPRILEVNTLLAREQARRLHFPWLAERVENALWRQERALICVSSKLKRLMIETAGIDTSKLVGFEISPVAVDVDRFNPSVPPAPELIEFKQGRPLAGYVGTLTAWHGVDLFFDVARILRDRGNPTIILPVGGEHDRVERLRQKTIDEGLQDNLHFYGSIDHQKVPSFLAAMDVCIIPDTQDWSSPTKFFEFAAMERPIIASRSPSVEEVFGATGTSGLFFKRGSAQGMVDAILKIQEDPALGLKLGQAARQRVQDKYTWAASVKTIMELYQAMGAHGVAMPPQPDDASAEDSHESQ